MERQGSLEGLLTYSLAEEQLSPIGRSPEDGISEEGR
jgi:hypothetical protein